LAVAFALSLSGTAAFSSFSDEDFERDELEEPDELWLFLLLVDELVFFAEAMEPVACPVAELFWDESSSLLAFPFSSLPVEFEVDWLLIALSGDALASRALKAFSCPPSSVAPPLAFLSPQRAGNMMPLPP
jgi:hypothetical protein